MPEILNKVMRIYKYIPEKMYGFAIDGTFQVFFHLEIFSPGPYATPPVPPILGERVEVVLKSGETLIQHPAPRASRVVRLDVPVAIRGFVSSFRESQGYGYIVGDDGASYYLHRSEVLNGRLPLDGQRVSFYLGHRQGKPRACFVSIL